MSKKALDSVRKLVSRRRALQGMGALFGATAIGCADDAATEGSGTGTEDEVGSESSDSETTDGTGTTDTTDGTDTIDTTDTTETTTDTTDTTDTTTDGGDACVDTDNLTAAQALAGVEHIIVLCMENRSFDHYFGARQLVEGQTDVEGLDGSESNPNGMGEDITVFHLQNFEPEDPPHSWDPTHAQWNNGANDGFVLEHLNANGAEVAHEVMGYHTREDIPVLWALADEYTLCDQWFCALLGPTWPNRYFLHCATSNGRQGNTPALPYPTTIQDVCGDAGISNKNYYGDVPWRWGAFPLQGFSGTSAMGNFFDALDDGSLEQVVIIDPSFTSNDDHPSHNITLGQALISTVYQALAQSQYWNKSLLIVTYDEHGGFFDHVAPPTTPDSGGPEWQQQGFRVPAVVIGPHVRKGCVNHTVFDHASFAATVCRKFGLAELNERCAGVNDLASCIDPSKIDDPQPPAPLPKVVVPIDEVMTRVGVETSQEELMRATGNWPITPAFTAAERRRIMELLEHGERLGALELVRS